MSFSYDDAGNRIRSLLNTYETTYTYDANNRILSKSYGNESVDYTYDNNGNQIKVEKYTKNSDGNKNITETKDYNYNGLNQLTNFNNVTKECSSTYKYMADGYRLSQTVDYDNLFVGHVTETTKYLWDNDNIVSFIDTDNNVKNNYYRGYMLICDDKDEYYMHDPHGNVIETYTADRQPYDYYRYNGYGTQKGFDDTDFVEHNNEWGYCDQLYDNFTHNYYMRARNYDPEIGRFINEDPIRSGSNWYSYCGGNPVNYIDDNGLAPKPIRQLMLAVDIVVSAAQLIKETYDYRGKNITDIVVGVWNDKNKLILDIGNSFGFDVKQGVFYFKNDTFQKGLGYSNTYDYASAFVGMNIDQKVFEFEYDEKNGELKCGKAIIV